MLGVRARVGKDDLLNVEFMSNLCIVEHGATRDTYSHSFICLFYVAAVEAKSTSREAVKLRVWEDDRGSLLRH